MTSIEKHQLNIDRINAGEWRVGDIRYQQCDICRDKLNYLCTYLFKFGRLYWTCGLCERNIIKKDRDMEYKIAIDADSIVSTSLHRQPDDLELAYYEFCSTIGVIKGAVFSGLHTYEKGDTVKVKILLTPRTNFRYDIFPSYKHKRPPRSENRIALMKMILERLKPWVEIKKNVEADDLAIYYAKQGWIISAIDKDVINASPVYCFNYRNYVWEQPKTDMQIEAWYLMQALMGDSVDCIPGAKGIGEKRAFEIVNDMSWKDFSGIIQYFDSYEDALTSMRLVRMDQYNGEEVILWEPNMAQNLI